MTNPLLLHTYLSPNMRLGAAAHSTFTDTCNNIFFPHAVSIDDDSLPLICIFRDVNDDNCSADNTEARGSLAGKLAAEESN